MHSHRILVKSIRSPHFGPAAKAGSSEMEAPGRVGGGGGTKYRRVALSNRVRAHEIDAGWVGLRPPSPPGRICMPIRSGGDPALSETGTSLRSPRFPGRGPFLPPVRLWATPGWSLQAARSPMRAIFHLPARPVRRPMTLRAVGLRAASSVLALERARHRHPCRTERRLPFIRHRRPPRVGRGSGFRGRGPAPPWRTAGPSAAVTSSTSLPALGGLASCPVTGFGRRMARYEDRSGGGKVLMMAELYPSAVDHREAEIRGTQWPQCQNVARPSLA